MLVEDSREDGIWFTCYIIISFPTVYSEQQLDIEDLGFLEGFITIPGLLLVCQIISISLLAFR
jgi:hypothetical protein